MKFKNILTLSLANDCLKDQTYFLSTIKSQVLEKVVFPLANYTKLEVIKIAKKIALPVYNRKESQDICFIKKTYKDFLLKRRVITKENKIRAAQTFKLIFINNLRNLYDFIVAYANIKLNNLARFFAICK